MRRRSQRLRDPRYGVGIEASHRMAKLSDGINGAGCSGQRRLRSRAHDQELRARHRRLAAELLRVQGWRAQVPPHHLAHALHQREVNLVAGARHADPPRAGEGRRAWPRRRRGTRRGPPAQAPADCARGAACQSARNRPCTAGRTMPFTASTRWAIGPKRSATGEASCDRRPGRGQRISSPGDSSERHAGRRLKRPVAHLDVGRAVAC